MPTYTVNAINVGSFNLGESDKLLTLFTAERGLIKAVAKGARKPGSKIAGRAEVLNVNRLLVSTGRSLDIITQAEGIENFSRLRHDLLRLSYALYYAEITQIFGQGVEGESLAYFDFLAESLQKQAESTEDATWLCLKFELALMQFLGYFPELTYCIICRQILTDMNLSVFDRELGGIACQKCHQKHSQSIVKERSDTYSEEYVQLKAAIQITPKVWKNLVLAAQGLDAPDLSIQVIRQSVIAAQRLLEKYIEHRASRKVKSLEMLAGITK
jgi:DNA repair protein RecO (recombination protein O)